MKDVKAREVQMRTVHDVKAAGLGNQPVQTVGVMYFSLRNTHKDRDGATNFQQGVKLDGTFGCFDANRKIDTESEHIG